MNIYSLFSIASYSYKTYPLYHSTIFIRKTFVIKWYIAK